MVLIDKLFEIDSLYVPRVVYTLAGKQKFRKEEKERNSFILNFLLNALATNKRLESQISECRRLIVCKGTSYTRQTI